MSDWLILMPNGTEHYFFRPYEGICCTRLTFGGAWSEHSVCIPRASNGFGVYSDKSSTVHIICTDKENRLIYAVRRNSEWKTYTLVELSRDISVSEMRLYSINNRINLLYSALYNGENLLVHCILGDHAKPSAISKLETPHFCIYNERVYYTNIDGELGYSELSDEKPSVFHKLYDDAHCGTLFGIDDKEILVFTRHSRLFVNGAEILYDSRLEEPILSQNGEKTYIMWKSGGLIRYIVSFNGGSTWSKPMRFMSTGLAPRLFIVQTPAEICKYYGYVGEKDVTLLGAPNIFFYPPTYTKKRM